MADSSTSNAGTNEVLEKLMESTFKGLEKADREASRNGADLEKTTKLFGMIELPQTAATVVEAFWNEGSAEFSNWVQKNSHVKFEKVASELGFRGKAITQTAAGATIALSAVIKSGLYIDPVIKAFGARRDMNQSLAHKLASELDALKKDHTVSALKHVKKTDNEAIYYAYQRQKMTTGMTIKNTFTKLLVNVIPSVAIEFPNYNRLWQGLPAPVQQVEESITRWGKKIARFGSAPMANTVINSNKRAFDRTIKTPYSAAEMILELAGQVENNPKVTSYQLPGSRSGSVSLERYIEQILEMHQKNMAELEPNEYVEIRPALKEDLTAIVKPLAHAIREGDLSAAALMDLVGTGKIIKKQGRALVNVAEVEALLEKLSVKPVSRDNGDPKAFYKEKAYTREDLKNVLPLLQGKELDFFVSLLPAFVVRDLGLSDKEIKQHQEGYLNTLEPGQKAETVYDRAAAGLVVGIHEQPKEILEKSLPNSQKRVIDKAFDAIAGDGVETAMHKLKTNPANAHGIEETLLDWAVPVILGDKERFGTVLQEGRTKLDDMATRPSHADKAEKSHDAQARSHAQKEPSHKDDHRPEGFQAREKQREGQHGGYHAERE